MLKRISVLLLAVMICVSLVAPAWATEAQTSEISITWLSVEGQPNSYSRTFGWLALDTGEEIPISETSYAIVTRLVDCSTGEVVDDYDFFGSLSEGLASVGKWEGNNRKCGYIDETRNVVIPLEYAWADVFSEGLAVVGVGDLADTKYGYINKKNEVIVQPEYDQARAFSNGVAVVAKENEYGILKWGLIDKTGEIIVPLEYDEINYETNRIDRISERILGGSIEDNPNLPIRVSKINSDGIKQYGYIDKNGEMSIPMMYDVAGDFVNGLARVGKKDENWDMKYGYIDTKGTVVIPLEYDSPNWYVASSDTYFLQDLVPIAKKDESGDMRSGYKFGYIDKSGAVIVQPIYESAGAFTADELAPVSLYEGDSDKIKAGYIDKAGNIVIPLEYASANPFCDGLATVMKQTDDGELLYGVIDKTGEEILSPEFASINIIYNVTDPQKDFLLANKKDSASEVYDRAGIAILPTGTQVSGSVMSSGYYGLIVAKQDSASGWGLFDMNGKVLLSETYDSISVRGSYIIVEKDDRCGFAENPYWEELDEEQPDSKGDFPVLPVVIGTVILAAVVIIIVLLVKKRNAKSPVEQHQQPRI